MLGQQVSRKKHLDTMLQDLYSQRNELEDKVNQLEKAKQKEQARIKEKVDELVVKATL